jgi:hypothetical protein
MFLLLRNGSPPHPPYLLICLHFAPPTHNHRHGIRCWYLLTSREIHPAPFSAFRLSDLNGKSISLLLAPAGLCWASSCSNYPLENLKLGLPSTWQSGHLFGPSTCNCTPSFWGCNSWLYPLFGKILQRVPVMITTTLPSAQKIPKVLQWPKD